MKFNVNAVNVKADCEAGAWLHFNDLYEPAKKLYADNKDKYPVRVKVKGGRSEAMKDLNDEVAKVQKDSSYDTPVDKDAEIVANLLIDWENIEIDGDSKFSPEAAKKLLLMIPEFKMQILGFAITLKNFKGSAKKS